MEVSIRCPHWSCQERHVWTATGETLRLALAQMDKDGLETIAVPMICPHANDFPLPCPDFVWETLTRSSIEAELLLPLRTPDGKRVEG